MAGEPTITVIGNLTADPELRFTQAGHAVANFTIAQTPRNYDRDSQQWVDDETLFVRGTVWREAAENAAESLTKGARVIAHGRLKARSFEDKQGNNRTAWELEVDEIGPSIRWATAQVNRAPRQNGGGAPQGGGYGQGPQGGGYGQGPQGGGYGQAPGGPQGGGFSQGGPPAGDPWAGGQNTGWDQGQNSPPPF